MAIYSGKMIKGAAGTFVFREVKKKQVVSRRLAPGEMKQTKATKRVAATFGMASKLGKQFRQTLKNAIVFYDPAVSRRMTNDLKDILIRCRDPKSTQFSFGDDSFNQLNGFDFNLKSPLRKNLVNNLKPDLVDGVLSIDLSGSNPRDVLIFPAGSSACELSIAISFFRLNDGLKVFNAETQSLKIEKYATGIAMQKFEFTVPDGCLCIVSVCLKFYVVLRELSTVINSKTFSPAGICAALITPGLYENTDKRSWVRMSNLKFKMKKLPVI